MFRDTNALTAAASTHLIIESHVIACMPATASPAFEKLPEHLLQHLIRSLRTVDVDLVPPAHQNLQHMANQE